MATQVIYQKFFNPQILATQPSLIYQVPAQPISCELRGGRIRIVNNDSAAHTFTAYAVPSGVLNPIPSASFGTNINVPVGSYIDICVPIMAINDALWMSASSPQVLVVHLLNGVLIQ